MHTQPSKFNTDAGVAVHITETACAVGNALYFLSIGPHTRPSRPATASENTYDRRAALPLDRASALFGDRP